MCLRVDIVANDYSTTSYAYDVSPVLTASFIRKLNYMANTLEPMK